MQVEDLLEMTAQWLSPTYISLSKKKSIMWIPPLIGSYDYYIFNLSITATALQKPILFFPYGGCCREALYMQT